MKKLILLVFLALLSGCVSGHRGSYQVGNNLMNKGQISDAMQSTIAFYDAKQKNIFCTGFFVEENIVVTAKHCVTDDNFEAIAKLHKKHPEWNLFDLYHENMTFEGIMVKDYLKNPDLQRPYRVEMKLLYMNEYIAEMPSKGKDDIAVLEIVHRHNYAKKWFKIAKRNPYPGMKVYAVGMPVGLDWLITEGNIGRINMYNINGKPHVKNYTANIFIAPGSSGGPLLDNNGRVIGLQSAGMFLNVGYESNVAISMSKNNIQSHVRMAKHVLKKRKKLR